jgi:antitoxin component YwqK of YwqJK toxin-antitoxin module
MAALFLILLLVANFTFWAHAADKAAGEVQQSTVTPKKVQVDTNNDGKPDRTEYYNPDGTPNKVEYDSNGDGIIEEIVIYEGGRPVKNTKDTNGDGKPDVWIEY